MEMESEFINDQMEKLKILKDNNNKDGNNTLGKIPNGFCENAHKLSNGINLADDKDDDKNVPVDKCNANKFTNETLETSSNGNNKNITNELEIKNKQGIDDVATLESEIVSKCNNIESNSKTNTDDVVMMSLDSNNSLFMRPKPSNETAIFADQNLPAFLEDSLNEQLSKIVIDSDEDQSGKVIEILAYEGEKQLPDLMTLISKDLSEPYSVYTYRYFLHNWPELSFLAYCDNVCVGAIVCKLDQHRKNVWRGYIAMLVVHGDYRRCKIGTKLVQRAIRKMINQGCDEVVLETEVTNKSALKLYENLGFIRDKRLLRYYLNGVDAWRLKLWLK